MVNAKAGLAPSQNVVAQSLGTTGVKVFSQIGLKSSVQKMKIFSRQIGASYEAVR